MSNLELEIPEQDWTTVSGRMLKRLTIAACGVLVIGAIPAVAQAAKSGATWNDEYTNKVTKTGVVKKYCDHERNIPEDVIAAKMKNIETAQTVWAGQNWKVKSVEGSVASGKVTVVVDFGYIEDTHVYVRDDPKKPCKP